MEYHGTRLSARTRRPQSARKRQAEPDGAPRTEPSWPTVIATTLQLWFERHPLMGRRASRRRRAGVVLAALVIIALGTGTGLAMAGIGSAAPAAADAPRLAPAATPDVLASSAAVRTAAATWIAGQVVSSAVVACDPAMCAALQTDGVPAGRLLALGTTAADPLGSDLVVATAAVRNQFGARLAGVYAPLVIASFGSGTGRIEVRAVAPDGAAAYRSALAADLRSRISAGVQLLRNPRITVSPAAREALSAGDVDPRLLLLLAAITQQQPVRIGAFGDASPGAGPAVPLRSVQLAPWGSGAKGTSGRAKSQLRPMLSFIDAQRQPYLPLRTSLSGTSTLAVEYAAPSPLGLLSGP